MLLPAALSDPCVRRAEATRSMPGECLGLHFRPAAAWQTQRLDRDQASGRESQGRKSGIAEAHGQRRRQPRSSTAHRAASHPAAVGMLSHAPVLCLSPLLWHLGKGPCDGATRDTPTRSPRARDASPASRGITLASARHAKRACSAASAGKHACTDARQRHLHEGAGTSGRLDEPRRQPSRGTAARRHRAQRRRCPGRAASTALAAACSRAHAQSHPRARRRCRVWPRRLRRCRWRRRRREAMQCDPQRGEA